MIGCLIRCVKTKKKFKITVNADCRHLPEEVQAELQQKVAELGKDFADALGYDTVYPSPSDVKMVRELNPDEDVHSDD